MSNESRKSLVAGIVAIVLLVVIALAIWFMFPPAKPKLEAIANPNPPATPPSPVSVQEPTPVQRLVVAGPKPRTINSTIPALSFDAKDGASENFDHLGYF